MTRADLHRFGALYGYPETDDLEIWLIWFLRAHAWWRSQSERPGEGT